MRGQRALGERVALVRRLAGGRAREQRLPLQLLRGRAAARGVRLRLGELRLQPREQPRRRLPLDGEARRTAAQLVRDRQRRLALAGGARQLLLDPRPLGRDLVEARLRRRARSPLGAEQPHERAARPLEARLPLDRRDARLLGGLARRPLQLRRLDSGLARVRLGRGQLRPNLLEQRRRRLAPDAEPLAAAAQPVQHLHRLLALPRGVGELLLGAAALGEHGVRAAPPRRDARAPRPCAARRPRRDASSSVARSSCASRARSRAISSRSFSARSAAVACRASGRRRFRTSSSRSRARST